LSTCASMPNASTYATTTTTDGHSLVNPSDSFSAVVPMTSATIASASSTYATTRHLPCRQRRQNSRHAKPEYLDNCPNTKRVVRHIGGT
jgi:hypothetical protein